MILQSFAPNQNDDVDKIKYYWSFFMPCAILLNGGQPYWYFKVKPVFLKLHKDILLNVRKSLAASLFEVMKLVDMDSKEDQAFFMDVLRHFMSDIEEVKAKITPNLCKIVGLYPEDQQTQLLTSFIKDALVFLSVF